jgi:aryl-alcohol dehydrogenase-like predicted oxidoreductase
MMDRIQLGELEVSRQGLGCMGMSEWYGSGDWDTSIATIHRAIELGVTLLDTADVYGSGHNEALVGRAIHDRRDQVQLATKFGVDRSSGDRERVIRGEAGYVKRSCESSLLRLGVDVIDLYYLHRPPQTAEIEEAVGAMAELVAEGKVRYLGLSEVDGDLLRRAHAVHPITAVQSEYSLWTRDVESVTPVMAELGIGLVPYSPLGRGYLTGTVDVTALDDKDFRGFNPRFSGDAGQANQAIVSAVRAVADRRGVTASQVALAWVYAQSSRLGVPIAPIPGTKRVKWLEQNVAALEVSLTSDDLGELDPLAEQVVGARY